MLLRQRMHPLPQSDDDDTGHDQDGTNPAGHRRQLVEEQVLPDKRKDDVGRTTDGYRTSVFALQRLRQQDLAGKAEQAQQDDHEALCPIDGQTELSEDQRDRSRYHYGKRGECGHHDGVVNGLQFTHDDVDSG